MQVQLQVLARKSESLRRRITQDLERQEYYDLYVERFKDPKRNPGWAKIKSRHVPGVINMEWDGSLRMLVVRAIAKHGNTPHQLLGTFVGFLIDRYGRRISSINIQMT